MAERHFTCTACGKCCYGWLPLTLDEALVHAGRFPLVLVWTPLRQGARAFSLTARLGTTVRLGKRKEFAVGVVPTSYIPPALACPALTTDGLCAIQDVKPTRCRTMPFSAYREEADQRDLLVPRPGWDCDVSAAAPVAYRDKEIVSRQDFDRERKALLDQAPILRRYADWLLAASPPLMENLLKMAAKPAGGHVIVNFATLLPHLPKVDMGDFTAKQAPLMVEFAARTAGIAALTDYHRRYRECAAELGAR
ncbi:MAG: YkgJ family cysteine cluster protein [Magnetospirillum sp. WYHS-4]